jgi:hypothetical protein
MDAPTAPVKPPAAEHDASAAAFDLKAGLADAADDAGSRVIPTLGDSHATPAVAAAFRSLAAAVRSGDAGAVQAAINQCNGSLNALVRSSPNTDPIEVAALRLVVLNAQVLYPAT